MGVFTSQLASCLKGQQIRSDQGICIDIDPYRPSRSSDIRPYLVTIKWQQMKISLALQVSPMQLVIIFNICHVGITGICCYIFEFQDKTSTQILPPTSDSSVKQVDLNSIRKYSQLIYTSVARHCNIYTLSASCLDAVQG